MPSSAYGTRIKARDKNINSDLKVQSPKEKTSTCYNYSGRSFEHLYSSQEYK